MGEENNVEIVEKRIKPTIIRRRKLVKEPEETEAEPTAQETASVAPEQEQAEPAELTEEEIPAWEEVAGPEEELEAEPTKVVRIPKEKVKPAKVLGRVELKGPVTGPPQESTESVEESAPPVQEELPVETPPEPAAPTREGRKAAKRQKDEFEETPRKKPRKRREVVTIDEDGVEELFGAAARKADRPYAAGRTVRKKVVSRPFRKTEITTPKAIKKVIRMEESIPVGELAQRMGVKTRKLLEKLRELDPDITVNDAITTDSASLVASEFGFEVESIALDVERILQRQEDSPESLVLRPPVVTIMGHVDHGKTLLLDAIRESNVVGGEAGGITQQIGAYRVESEKGTIVFIDTPGHEAFTAMRARGARVTDIVVLVVAADDGVMPQTIEAINHARAAQVPIIVAINKIDKADANQEKVKSDLTEHGLLAEEWGGQTLVAEVSAKEKKGIGDLLELILLQAEMLDLKSNPSKAGRGVVIETRLDKGRGIVGTVIVQEGTLRAGDAFVAGSTVGRLRTMVDEHGRRLKKAGPATPVEAVGFTEMPEAGDDFVVVKNEKLGKEVSSYRKRKIQGEAAGVRAERPSLEDLYERIQQGETKELKIVLKGDTQGAIEAVRGALEKLSLDEVKVNVIHDGVGGVSETDVNLAAASDAVIIGFGVSPVGKARGLAEQEKVDLRTYDIIYEMLDDVERAIKGLLEPIRKEVFLGNAEVRAVFRVSRVGAIAGSYVTEGKITRGAKVRIHRNGDVVHEGEISSLKRFKDDVKEVAVGYECGIGVHGYGDWETGDVIEVYTFEDVSA
jgi:translation initiation factor IF-2